MPLGNDPQNPAPAPYGSVDQQFQQFLAANNLSLPGAGGGFAGGFAGSTAHLPDQKPAVPGERTGFQEHGARAPIHDSPDDFYTWSDSELEQFRKLAISAGLVNQNASLTDLYNAWNDLNAHAQKYQAAGRNIRPWDLLNAQVDVNGDGSMGFTGKKSRTDKTIKAVDPRAAEGAIRDQLREMIGQDPTASQLKRLTGRFRQYFAAHPEVTKTTAQYQNGDIVNQTSEVVSPGATVEGAMQDVQDSVQATDEYGAYQAATTYFNAMMQMLQGG